MMIQVLTTKAKTTWTQKEGHGPALGGKFEDGGFWGN